MRGMIKVCSEAMNKCYEVDADTEDLLDSIEKKVLEVRYNNKDSSVKEFKDHIAETFAYLNKVINKEIEVGIPTGFPDLDKLVIGLKPGEMFVLAARPSIGKTSIALNILNLGRYKLGAGCVGACKDLINKTIQYTSEREQFGRPVNQFGLIQEKLADMAAFTFAAESAAYRTAGLIQKAHELAEGAGDKAGKIKQDAVKEYAIECSILKVVCSEVLDFVADEALQAYGGYGYIAEFPIEGAYRDARINRIFEGTNEINRLLIPGLLIKKGMKGELNIMAAVQAVQKEMTELPVLSEATGAVFEQELKILEGAKKGVLLASGAGIQKYGSKLENEQELLARVADCIADIFVFESALLRTLKLIHSEGVETAQGAIDMVKVFAVAVALRVDGRLKECAASLAEGDDLRVLLVAFRRFTKIVPPDTRQVRRAIAGRLIKQGKYAI